MKGRSELWTEAETAEAVRMKAEGMEVPAIARALRRSAGAVHCRFKFIALTPEQRAARYKKYHGKEKERRKQDRDCKSGLYVRYIHRPTTEQIAERDARFGMDRTIGQLLLGEPLPGQSALDKRKQEACHGTM